MKKGITVIVPTVGREGLQRTLESFAGDLALEDDVVVIHDGPNHTVGSFVRLMQGWSDGSWYYLETKEIQGAVGHPLRNRVLDNHVKTTHVWTIDDDDEAAPGALKAMRNHMDDPWTIFKMHFGPGHPASGLTLPASRQIRFGNVGTPMIFAPTTQARFGHHYSGDLDYAAALYSELGEPVWAEETVAIIRP